MSLYNCPNCGEPWTNHTTACQLKRASSFDQRLVDRIVARAQNSQIGLGDPDKGRGSYDLSAADETEGIKYGKETNFQK